MESSSAGAHGLHGGVMPTVVIVSTDMVAARICDGFGDSKWWRSGGLW